MAAQTFVTKLIANVKPESEWLANESYFILPNENVEAYTIQKVEVNGENKDMLFLRSKTNTTDSKKLFKELPYNDEYLMYMVQDNIDSAVNTIKTQVTQNTNNISDLRTDTDSIFDEIDTIKNQISQGPDTSALETKITQNTNNIADLRTDVDLIGEQVDGKADTSLLDNYLPKAGGTATGAIKMPTPSATTKDDTLATTKFVSDALANIEIPDTGVKVVLSSTEPTDMKEGDIWLKQV